MKSSPGRSRAGSRLRKGGERAADGESPGAPSAAAGTRAGTGGSGRPAARRPAARPAGSLATPALFERLDREAFPASLYIDGPSEPLKAALLAELRHAWAKRDGGAEPARVLRAAESSVEEILS